METDDDKTGLGDIAPALVLKNGEILADSRDVAAKFEKKHFHVLEAIRNLDCSAEFKASNFRSFKISDLTGESTF